MFFLVTSHFNKSGIIKSFIPQFLPKHSRSIHCFSVWNYDTGCMICYVYVLHFQLNWADIMGTLFIVLHRLNIISFKQSRDNGHVLFYTLHRLNTTYYIWFYITILTLLLCFQNSVELRRDDVIDDGAVEEEVWLNEEGREEEEGLAERALRKGVLWQQRDKLFSRWKVN